MLTTGLCLQVMYRDVCSNDVYVEKTTMDQTAQVPYTFSNPTWVSYDNQAAYLNKVGSTYSENVMRRTDLLASFDNTRTMNSYPNCTPYMHRFS